MSRSTADREYYRKAAGYIRVARIAVLVILVVFTVFSMTVHREEITLENLRYLMRYIDIQSPGTAGGDGRVGFVAGEDAYYRMLGDKLVVFDDKRVSSYDFTGHKLFSENISYINPVCTANDKYLLVYDHYGRGLSVYNSFSKVSEKKLSTDTEYIYLDKNGSFAAITKEKSYSGGFVVYDSNFNKSYSFMSRDMNITDVALLSGKHTAVCATTGAKNGDFYSKVLFFDISTEQEPREYELYGQMPLSLFASHNTVVLATDGGMYFFDCDGVNTAHVPFGTDTLSGIYRFDDFFAVCLKTAETGVDTVVKLYDYKGNTLFTSQHKSEVFNISYKNGKILILEHFLLNTLSYDKGIVSVSETISVDGEFKKAFATTGGYVLVSSSGAVESKYSSSAE